MKVQSRQQVVLLLWNAILTVGRHIPTSTGSRRTISSPVAFVTSSSGARPRGIHNVLLATGRLPSPSQLSSTIRPSPARHHRLRYWCSTPRDDNANGSSLSIESIRNSTRTEPFEWEELHQLIVVQKKLDGLCRSVEEEERYRQHRLQVKETYDSMYDYIIHSKFQLPREYNQDTNRWRVLVSDDDGTWEDRTVLVPNDFPYFTADGIDHWVLWKLGGTVDQEDVKQALASLHHDWNLSDTIYWENPPHLKSLPDIDHIHILVRRQ